MSWLTDVLAKLSRCGASASPSVADFHAAVPVARRRTFGTRSAWQYRVATETFDIIGMGNRVKNRVQRKRAARIIGGTALAIAGAMRGGLLGPLMVLGGAALFVRGSTDKPLKESWHRIERWLAAPHAHRFGDGKRDVVDEASWQSFPASDPPGYSVGAGQPSTPR